MILRCVDEVSRYACYIDVSMDEKYYFNDDKGVLQSADNLIFSYSCNRGEDAFLKDGLLFIIISGLFQTLPLFITF